MRKTRPFFLLAVIIFVIVGCLLAANFRKQIQHVVLTDEALAHYSVVSIRPETGMAAMAESPETKLANVQTTSASELAARSSLIVVATPTGLREAFQETVLSEMKIRQILKHEDSKPIQDKILVYEPIRVNSWGRVLLLEGALNLMQVDRQYLLCLNFYEKPSGYRLNEDEQRMYLLANPHVGILALEEPIAELRVLADDHSRLYKDIQQYDYLFSNDVERNMYLSLRETFLQTWLPEHGKD